MAAIQTAPALPRPVYISSSNHLTLPKPKLGINFKHSISTPLNSHNFPFCPHPLPANTKIIFEFKRHSTVQEVAVDTQQEKSTSTASNIKRKLYVSNLPWSFSVSDIKNLFGQCGTVSDVEIIKQKDGRSSRFIFVTMSSGEEAQAAIDKLDSFEVLGRTIRVEFSKRYKKPSSPTPAGIPVGETRHKLYVSNLAWKVRGTHLRQLFSEKFNPVSSRVVLDGPSGRSTGYGFVSFATREEAKAAISALNEKELMGRPIRLKFSVNNAEETESKEKASQPKE